jgi:hypothetical protein
MNQYFYSNSDLDVNNWNTTVQQPSVFSPQSSLSPVSAQNSSYYFNDTKETNVSTSLVYDSPQMPNGQFKIFKWMQIKRTPTNYNNCKHHFTCIQPTWDQNYGRTTRNKFDILVVGP